MGFLKNKKTRALILIMGALALTVLIISDFYYSNENESIDPRVVGARILYEQYNGYVERSEIDSIMWLLDTIEKIYSGIDHYKNAFEVGVLQNNRAAIYLTVGIFSDNINSYEQDSLTSLANREVNSSIRIYEDWINIFQNKTALEIESIIEPDFLRNFEVEDETEFKKYLKNRGKEIENSISETHRRLSVSYTNLGIIYRHTLKYDSAAISYKHAIDLWDRNITAENNLNVLLGRPTRKRSFIEKMFPPDRD